MKKNPLILAGACLFLGMFGCATDDEVQKGYLTPQQTASTSSTETSSTATSSDTSSTTSERLPPPSVKENVATTESSASTSTTTSTPSSSESTAESTPSSSESSTTTTTTTETASTEKPSSSTSKPKPSASGPSPSAIAKNKQQLGGKTGGAGASIKRSSQLDTVEKERPEQERRRSPNVSERRHVEEELDADEEVTRAKKPSSSGVSSSFSPGTTRVADPTGSAKGVILNVNLGAKFVVIKFQYRAIPSVGKVLSVMRNGVKVGQIRITKPIKPPHATADILEGNIQRGDAVE